MFVCLWCVCVCVDLLVWIYIYICVCKEEDGRKSDKELFCWSKEAYLFVFVLLIIFDVCVANDQGLVLSSGSITQKTFNFGCSSPPIFAIVCITFVAVILSIRDIEMC